jgi:hypothetical protein
VLLLPGYPLDMATGRYKSEDGFAVRLFGDKLMIMSAEGN